MEHVCKADINTEMLCRSLKLLEGVLGHVKLQMHSDHRGFAVLTSQGLLHYMSCSKIDGGFRPLVGADLLEQSREPSMVPKQLE